MMLGEAEMASPFFFSFWDSRLLFIIIACEKLAARIAVIQREKEEKEYRAKRISLFMRMLAGQEECFQPCSQRIRKKIGG